MMKRLVLLLLASLWLPQVIAESPNVLSWQLNHNLDSSYKVIYKHLEENGFYVVFEPNIQKNLARFAERWGEDYNRNKLEGIRAMVFCSGWYANRVSNADPDMLALCPLHITLIQQQGQTRVLFARPSVIAAGSEALEIAKQMEADVSKAIAAAAEELRACKAEC